MNIISMAIHLVDVDMALYLLQAEDADELPRRPRSMKEKALETIASCCSRTFIKKLDAPPEIGGGRGKKKPEMCERERGQSINLELVIPKLRGEKV